MWKWESISSSSCWMSTESGLTRYWLEARRSWCPALMDAVCTRWQFLMQDAARLDSNTSPATRSRMILANFSLSADRKFQNLTKHGGEVLE